MGYRLVACFSSCSGSLRRAWQAGWGEVISRGVHYGALVIQACWGVGERLTWSLFHLQWQPPWRQDRRYDGVKSPCLLRSCPPSHLSFLLSGTLVLLFALVWQDCWAQDGLPAPCGLCLYDRPTSSAQGLSDCCTLSGPSGSD